MEESRGSTVKSLRREDNNLFNRATEPNPDRLHLLEPSEFLPSIGKWTTMGAVVLVGTFVAGVMLASVLKYKITVKAPAIIRPAGELRLVQAAVEGTIVQVEVEENQLVEKGQTLARIDDSRLQTQKSQLQNSLQQSQLQLRQVDAQLGDLDAHILAETNSINRAILAARAELEGIQRDYEDRKIKAQADLAQALASLNLAKEQRERLQRDNVLKTTVREAEVALKIAREQLDRLQRENVLKATVEEAEAALKLARVQRDRLQPIAESGAISLYQFEEQQQAVKVAEAKLEQTKAAVKSQLEEKQLAVKMAEAKLAQARAAAKDRLGEKELAAEVAALDVKKAETAIDPSAAAVTAATERIERERARGEATLATLNQERETLLQQRIELQKQRDRAGKELQQVENDLQLTVIRSPVEGTLLQLKLRNQGQVVQPSEAIAYIAPRNAAAIVKARVQEKDIDKVKPGQRVQIQVSACPYPDYGTLEGTVKAVAPDALPPAPNAAQSVPQAGYEVTVEPQQTYLSNGSRQCRLQSGMEGKADIISREETVLRFILRKAKLLTDL